MIVVKIEGGLANRMFQYAFFLSLRKRNDNVYLDEKSFKPFMEFDKFSLRNTFPNIDFPECDLSDFKIETRHGRINYFIRNIVEKISKKYFFQEEFRYYPELFEALPNKVYLRGYWQSEKYFIDVKDEVRRAFTFDPFTEERNIEVSSQMSKENSVSIHIRKGKDYMNKRMTYGTCPLNYYKDAISYINKNIKDPVFYIFTDNPQWVKENLSFINYTLVDWNPVAGNKNYRDIQLMSCCKHNIIANSSFSWWGAWLNPNDNKVVIGPKMWFNPDGDIKVFGDILCDTWIPM